MNRLESLGGKLNGFVFKGSVRTTGPRKNNNKPLMEITSKITKRPMMIKPMQAGSKTRGGPRQQAKEAVDINW